jgi:hypothetical protein
MGTTKLYQNMGAIGLHMVLGKKRKKIGGHLIQLGGRRVVDGSSKKN